MPIFAILLGALWGQRFRQPRYWLWSALAVLAWLVTSNVFHVEQGPVGRWLMSSQDGAVRSVGFLAAVVLQFVPPAALWWHGFTGSTGQTTERP